MRMLACTIPVIGMILLAVPARAQTYDPNYPVCLQTYGIELYIAGSVRRDGVRPCRAMLEQPVFRVWLQRTATPGSVESVSRDVACCDPVRSLIVR